MRGWLRPRSAAVRRTIQADMAQTYEAWLARVKDALSSMCMAMDEWQRMWPFEFRAEFDAGEDADSTAMKANRFWWREQNRSLKTGLSCHAELLAAYGAQTAVPAGVFPRHGPLPRGI